MRLMDNESGLHREYAFAHASILRIEQNTKKKQHTIPGLAAMEYCFWDSPT